MKLTKVFYARLGMKGSERTKTLIISALCFGFFALGLQDSQAQVMGTADPKVPHTKIDLGDTRADQVISLIQAEADLMTQEAKSYTGVPAEKSAALSAYYEAAIIAFDRNGADIKSALLDIRLTLGGQSLDAVSSYSPGNPIIDPNSAEYMDLRQLVYDMDLRDLDDSDLVAIFTFWRTHKNS